MIRAEDNDMFEVFSSPTALTRRRPYERGERPQPLVSSNGIGWPMSFMLCEGLGVNCLGCVPVHDRVRAFSVQWGPSQGSFSLVLQPSL